MDVVEHLTFEACPEGEVKIAVAEVAAYPLERLEYASTTKDQGTIFAIAGSSMYVITVDDLNIILINVLREEPKFKRANNLLGTSVRNEMMKMRRKLHS